MNDLMWEILVPTHMAGTEVPLAYHQEWDAQVMRLSDGMTVYRAAIGRWLHPEHGEQVAESMIPVRISCSRTAIRKIMSLTLRHYAQNTVLAYLVSSEVLTLDEWENAL